MNNDIVKIKRRVKTLLLIFIVGLVFSGITAFPIHWQLTQAMNLIHYYEWNNQITEWLQQVYQGVDETYSKFPFIAYGTDWLAFAHLMIAVAFIGPLRDPVKNIWVIEFGLISCFCVLPLAFFAGSFRAIPIFWQLIDCSFGIIGGIMLLSVYKDVKKLVANRLT